MNSCEVVCGKCKALKQRFKDMMDREERLAQKLQAMEVAVSKLTSENDRLKLENTTLLSQVSSLQSVEVKPEPNQCSALLKKATEIVKGHAHEILAVSSQRNKLMQKCNELIRLSDQQDTLMRQIPLKLQRLIAYVNSEGLSRSDVTRDWAVFGVNVEDLLRQNEQQKQRTEGFNALSDVLKYLQSSGMDSKIAETAISFIKSLMKTQKELLAEIEGEKRRSQKMSEQLTKVRMEIGVVDDSAIDGMEKAIQKKIKELKKKQATSEEASKFQLIDEIEPDYNDIKEYVLKMRETSAGRKRIREMLREIGEIDFENDRKIMGALEQLKRRLEQAREEHKTIDDLVAELVPAASSEGNYMDKLASILQAAKQHLKREKEEHQLIDELERKVTGHQSESVDYVARIRNIASEAVDRERLRETERKLEAKRQKIRDLQTKCSEKTQGIARDAQARMEQQARTIHRIKKHLKITNGNCNDIVHELKRLNRMRMSGAISVKRMRQIILRIISHLSIYTDPRLQPQREQLMNWLQAGENDPSSDIYAPIDHIFNTLEDIYSRGNNAEPQPRAQPPTDHYAQPTPQPYPQAPQQYAQPQGSQQYPQPAQQQYTQAAPQPYPQAPQQYPQSAPQPYAQPQPYWQPTFAVNMCSPMSQPYTQPPPEQAQQPKAKAKPTNNDDVQEFSKKHTPFMHTQASTWPEYCKELIYNVNHGYTAPIPTDAETYFVQQLRLQKRYLVAAQGSEVVNDIISHQCRKPILSLRTLIYASVFIQMSHHRKFPNAVAAIERLRMLHPFVDI